MMKKFILALFIILLLLAPVADTLATSGPAVIIPNGVGTFTNLSKKGTSNWWAASTNDGDTSYVYEDSGVELYDTYSCTNLPPDLGTITSVQIRMVSGGSGSAWTVLYTNSIEYFGNVTSLGTYTTYYTTYTLNPDTGLTWTESDVNSMEIGVKLSGNISAAKCTQVYAVVTFDSLGGVVPTVIELPPVLPKEADEEITTLPFYDLFRPAEEGLGWGGAKEKLWEYYNTGDSSYDYAQGTRWLCQTFTTYTTHKITKVKLLLYKNGTPGTVTVGIYNTSGGEPTGSALTFNTFSGDTLTSNTDGEWKEIVFTSYTLNAGAQYAIVISESADLENYVAWRYAVPGTYDSGKGGYSTNSGTTWTWEY